MQQQAEPAPAAAAGSTQQQVSEDTGKLPNSPSQPQQVGLGGEGLARHDTATHQQQASPKQEQRKPSTSHANDRYLSSEQLRSKLSALEQHAKVQKRARQRAAASKQNMQQEVTKAQQEVQEVQKHLTRQQKAGLNVLPEHMEVVQLVIDAIEQLGSSELFQEMAKAALAGQLQARPAVYDLLLSTARNLRVEHTSSWRFGKHLMTLLAAAMHCRSGTAALDLLRGPASKVSVRRIDGSAAPMGCTNGMPCLHAVFAVAGSMRV